MTSTVTERRVSRLLRLRPLQAWFAFWFEPAEQRSMALCRMVFGAVVFFAHAELIGNFAMLYGRSGIGGGQFREHLPGPHVIARSSYASLTWLTELGDGPLRALFALLLISSLAFAVGCFTRPSGVAMIALHVLFLGRLQQVFWGWAVMLPPLAAYVVASPASRAFSIDAAFRGLEAPLRAPAFPLRLLQIHCVCIYLTVVAARLGTPYWMDGSALYRILSDRTFSRLPEAWHEAKTPLAVVGSLALALEASAVFLLWRRVSRYVAFGLIAMHLGLEALTMVGWWNAILVAVLAPFVAAGWGGGPSSGPAPAAPVTPTLARWLLTASLGVYACLLVLASLGWAPWPRSYRVLRRTTRTAAIVLNRATIQAGLALFYDPRDTPVLRRGNCVTVEATGAAGTRDRDRFPSAHCEGRPTPWELPKTAHAVIMLLYDAAELRPDVVDWDFPTRGPTHVAAIAEYYCHGRRRSFTPTRLRLLWEQDFRDIGTDREWRKPVLDASWDCAAHRFDAMEWDLTMAPPNDAALPP